MTSKMEVDGEKCGVAVGPVSTGSVSVSLHPLVIMNISEHWTRVSAQEGKPTQGMECIECESAKMRNTNTNLARNSNHDTNPNLCITITQSLIQTLLVDVFCTLYGVVFVVSLLHIRSVSRSGSRTSYLPNLESLSNRYSAI